MFFHCQNSRGISKPWVYALAFGKPGYIDPEFPLLNFLSDLLDVRRQAGEDLRPPALLQDHCSQYSESLSCLSSHGFIDLNPEMIKPICEHTI